MWFKWRQKIMGMVIFIMALSLCQAKTATLSLDLQNANMNEAIQVIAKFLHQNVILSPDIQGTISLHLQEATAAEVFDLLLASRGMAKWPMGNVWFIAPRDVLIKEKQDEAKWQAVIEDSTPLSMQTWQIQYGKAQDIARMFEEDRNILLSSRGHIRVDTRTNTLCIQDIPARLEIARRLIARLDVPVKQIVIRARLVSVDHDCERELGILFGIVPPSSSSSEGVAKSATFVPGEYSLALARLADGSQLDIKLAAMENKGHAELISNPSLFTANQQTASIETGEEIPYQEVSDSGGTAVVFKKAVLGLKVTPQILPGNKVLLQMQINQDRPSNRLILGMPTIGTRQIMTNVLVKNGQTIVLGGIYEISNETGEERIPFLSQVPVVGKLFTDQRTRDSKRELLIFVTPTIL